ncbi:MAG: DUF551 domain-containing protein [Muribaculaceae bacterium]|nr:DUF551 domain-containing protein [Muribaculaceae bacterium]
MTTIEKKANLHAEKIFPQMVEKYQSAPLNEFKDAIADIYMTGAKEALAGQWIDPKEDLPEDGVYVLLSDGLGRFMGYYNASEHQWYGSGIGVVVDICYWMAVPELPKAKSL